jgi:geranylgeranyl diphosphate synthase type I
MFLKIKNKVEQELISFIRDIDTSYRLSKISSLLFKNIEEFISREGKRIRPILFVIGYLGYAKKAAPGLYRSAVALELLHDFMLVHDDIIDKSDTRRGKPSMHANLNKYLFRFKKPKFSGEDLTIVVGDVLYAMALHAFLSVREDMQRKEAALKKLIEAAFYTAGGEFVELLYSLKRIDEIKKEDIYKIYDLKTAIYTFAAPLAMGATLAGASKKQADALFNYGVYLGRAFQIQDDILGSFGEEAKTGKSCLTDLQEAKKTILIWYAYNNSAAKNKSAIKKMLTQENIGQKELLLMREVLIESGSLEYAKTQIIVQINKAASLLKQSGMQPKFVKALDSFSRKTLSL